MENLVNFIRIRRNLSFLIVATILGAASGGCSEGVGDPCMPEYVSTQGFSDNDVYIEASSVQCETRVCGVFKFKGNPRELYNDPAYRSCVDERVFCTCRCRAPSSAFATCTCPDGYQCSDDILEAAGEGLRGGYCVKTGIMSSKSCQLPQ